MKKIVRAAPNTANEEMNGYPESRMEPVPITLSPDRQRRCSLQLHDVLVLIDSRNDTCLDSK